MMDTSCFLRIAALAIFLASFGVSQVAAYDEAKTKAKSPPPKTSRLVYKAKPRRTLAIYYPDDWKPTDKRPALVIFRCRIPAQREHFRKLGMLIVKPQLAGVNSGRLPGLSLKEIAALPKPRNQVADTKSAIRYVRKHAKRLGIDPSRIVATGTSGGGDLALQSYLNKAFEDPRDDRSVSPRPNVLVLYCPAFDGIDIWFVKKETMLQKVKTDAPAFLPLLARFIENTRGEYVTPLDHRVDLIQLAATLGKEKGIDESEIAGFQEALRLFNKRDWQLLHPIKDALKMSASRILTKEPFPPTLIMFGDRDHLYEHQMAFVAKARKAGKKFDLKIFKNGGHSFMLQPAFLEPSTREVERFLKSLKYLP